MIKLLLLSQVLICINNNQTIQKRTMQFIRLNQDQLEQKMNSDLGAFFLFFEKYDGDTEDVQRLFLMAKDNLENMVQFDVYGIHHNPSKELRQRFKIVNRAFVYRDFNGNLMLYEGHPNVNAIKNFVQRQSKFTINRVPILKHYYSLDQILS